MKQKVLFLSLFIFIFSFSIVIASEDNGLDQVNGKITNEASLLDLAEPGLLPDHPLYFAKIWWEKIGLFFTFDNVKKAEKYINIAEKRVAEYRRMIDKDKFDKAEKTIAQYEKMLNKGLGKIEEAKKFGKDVEDLSNLATEKIADHQKVLAEVYEKVPENARPAIKKALEMSEQGYNKAVEVISNKDSRAKALEKAKNIKAIIEKSVGEINKELQE